MNFGIIKQRPCPCKGLNICRVGVVRLSCLSLSDVQGLAVEQAVQTPLMTCRGQLPMRC